ncbi:hypothetical protein QU926_12715 [Pseudomonas asiatica]|uniref:hypothetical protein n=1 Tax=Pseudomonas asiatica TaxID=2219225 RepID=UPI0025AAC268|nr:hypothetical protein [Pseudomonas asiatica]MDM9554514.1 hypothetical protein [Pseudomonas asiatica]
MIGQAVDINTLRVLASTGQVREAVAGRPKDHRSRWELGIRVGGPSARLIPVRSKREPMKSWASLDTLVKFAEECGLDGLRIEL